MPLVIVTGPPSSGKSTIAQRLQKFIQDRLEQAQDPRQTRIISDSDALDWDGRNVIFNSIAKEKELRGSLKADVQRYVNLNQIVILDASVYIKGFRYELYCVSKEAKTQYCIIELLLDRNLCWTWNERRISDVEQDADDDSPMLGYDRPTFEALLLRYERCDEDNRWDSPLFRVTNESDQLDFEAIYDSITKREPLAPNKCTLTSTTTSTIYKPH